MELTDLEICKRIAEIEGIKVSESVMQLGCDLIPTGRGMIDDNFMQYSPLENDALCFRLMIKYEINLSYDFKSCNNRYVCFHNKHIETTLSRSVGANKAICLAIIEANK